VKILAVDTALGACSAAVVEGTRVLGEEWREMPRGHAEALAPMVEVLMRGAGLCFAQLDRLAVTTGPGTFTGQRVGLAFMRALALALKKPAIGVTTLDAMAEEALAKDESAGWAIIAADAKRGEVYLCARRRMAPLLAPLLVTLDSVVTHIEAAARELGSRVVVAGTAADSVISLLRAAGLQPLDSEIRQPRARYVAFLAASLEASSPPKPLYLRPPDAKLPGSSS